MQGVNTQPGPGRISVGPKASQNLELRLRLALRRRSLRWARPTVSTPAMHILLHRFVFLLLRIGENGLDFAFGVALNVLHSGPAGPAVERLILEQILHFLLTVEQHRLDLALLVGGQVQLFGHAP